MTRLLSIRWRLTLWYGAAMTVAMIVFSVAIFWLTARSQSARIDFELDEEMHEIAYEVSSITDHDQLLRELQAKFGSHETFDFDITRRDSSAMFLSERLKRQRLFDGADWPTQPTSVVRVLPGLGEHRVFRKAIESPHGALLLHVAIPMTPLHEAQRLLLRTMGLVGPLMLLVTLAGGYWLARRALAPIEQITETAQRITAQRLDQRLDVSPVRDEISHLARTLNDMIDRLHRSFEKMCRFTADASHELRTPLTVLRTQLEVALRADRTPEEYREVLVSLHEDTVRMCRLASQLLELSREDAGVEAVPFTTVRLDKVLQESIDQVRRAAELKSLRLDVANWPPTEVFGDAHRLQRVFVNILDNAVKNTPSDGHIRVTISATNDSIELVIADTGCGIPTEHLPHIFDRFYRADPARTSPDGSGLGLAICQSIVHAHHGRVELQSTLGQGTTVTVSLPTE